jgi:hypothetical protein
LRRFINRKPIIFKFCFSRTNQIELTNIHKYYWIIAKVVVRLLMQINDFFLASLAIWKQFRVGASGPPVFEDNGAEEFLLLN